MARGQTVTLSGVVRLDPTTGSVRVRRFRVKVTSGPDAGAEAALDGPLVVGTGADCALKLTDETVSRQHLEITPRADGARIRDLSSRNGTFVAGVRIDTAFVQRGGGFAAGKTKLELVLDREIDAGVVEGKSLGPALGSSPAMRRVLGVLSRVARTRSSVVMMGETGTGKSLLAKALHQASPQAKEPFVVFDCAAVKASLIESELFGHAKGAFTGATTDREGMLAAAGKGTLFLDEVGELPRELQTRLLRVLETGMFQRVGDDAPRECHARFVAATHRDLDAEVAQGRFREDLYFRLAVVVVQVPPLRERREDIPGLARHFLEELGRGDFELSPPLLERFASHSWPGNVRELRNTLERAVVGITQDAPVKKRALMDAEWKKLPFREAKEQLVDAFTREYLEAMLDRCDRNMSEVARTAKIARAWVYKLVKKYGLDAV